MALTRVTSGGVAPGINIQFSNTDTPGTPTISFEGDTDTGMYRSGADEISFSTAGEKRFTIKANGDLVKANGTIIGGSNPDFNNATNVMLHVNQSDLNATDAITNSGGNINQPFKTIERALLEAARRSFVSDVTGGSGSGVKLRVVVAANGSAAVTLLEGGSGYVDNEVLTISRTNRWGGATDITVAVNGVNGTGVIAAIDTPTNVSATANRIAGTYDVDANNDRFEAYTIMVMPGDYEVDNRPGVVGVANLPTTANFESELYKFNPKSGGVVVPRGTSVVGYDLRKTVIRPKYVPNPGSKLGSDIGDNLGISHAAYDAAKMIEKARGYIIDQSYLYINQASTFTDEIDPTDKAAGGVKCKRDIGYFVDSIITDLREGGNANTFNIGQRYTDGTGIIQSLLTSSTTNISVTNAVYVPATGALTLTVASGHGLSTGDYIKIPTDGLKFKCAMDGSTSVKTYPRSSDPAVNQPLKVTVSSNDITVNVGATLDDPLDIRTANVGGGAHIPRYAHADAAWAGASAGDMEVTLKGTTKLTSGTAVRINEESFAFQCNTGLGSVTKYYPRASGATGANNRAGADPSYNWATNIKSVGSSFYVAELVGNGLPGSGGTSFDHLTGILTIKVTGHGLKQGDQIKIKTGGLRFSCNNSGVGNEDYPKAGQPDEDTALTVRNITTDTFDVLINDGTPTSHVAAHTFIADQNATGSIEILKSKLVLEVGVASGSGATVHTFVAPSAVARNSGTTGDSLFTVAAGSGSHLTAYTPANGVLKLNIGAGHTIDDGDYIQIADESLRFSCDVGGVAERLYPRPAGVVTHTPTTATTYNPSTGDLVVTTGSAHGMVNGTEVLIPNDMFEFSCGYAGNVHNYVGTTSDGANAVQDENGTAYSVTDASYNPGTGILELTIPNHTLLDSNKLKVLQDKLKFTCNEDGNRTVHTYPRATDPKFNTLVDIDSVTTDTVTINVGTALKRTYPRAGDPTQGKWLPISSASGSVFTVNVGISPNKSAHTCTAVAGVIKEKDYASGNWLKVFATDQTNGTVSVQVLANNAQGAAGSAATTPGNVAHTFLTTSNSGVNAVRRSQILAGGEYTHTFVNASAGSYTPVITKGGNEVDATIAAFNYARDLAIKSYHQFSDSYGYTEIVTGSSVSQPSYVAGVDYTTGTTCADIDATVNTLTAVATTILTNPDTYTTLVSKVPGVFERTALFKVTGGCYFWQMTFKDAKNANTTYDSVSFNANGVPAFTSPSSVAYSHHRVVCFTYADQRTKDGELSTYYKKVDQWDTTVDGGNPRKTKLEEYEIVGDLSLKTTIDTVNSASPYTFNCSLRSIYGLCGMHADGSKVAENSFKSMVVAQFTGISLQKDNNAFYQPKDLEGDTDNATYNNNTTAPIYADPDAQYRPEWRHHHIKATDGAFIQVVSVFAVGYADQFIAEGGGDMSITNSNSNFGQISLRAKGSQFGSFKPASQGRITALVPPRGIAKDAANTDFYSIDYATTWQKNGQNDKIYSAGTVTGFTDDNDNMFRLYLDIGGLNSESDIPEIIVEGKNYNGNTTVTKRFLNFGSNNNYNLFRDYYSTSGVVQEDNAKIQTTVETETGGINVYKAKLSLTANTALDYVANTPNNAQRQGYFWDPSVNKIYVKLDADNAETDTFLTSFVFATKTESVFTTTETTNPDGSISVTTGTSEITVLQYFDGFPSSLQTSKQLDTRASTPSDLLWRVEYTIPKDCANATFDNGSANTNASVPKAPEKRFLIKGTRPGNGDDNMPYTDYRFMIYDVEEMTSWEKDVRDGRYFLTLIRADVNKYINTHGSTAGSHNQPVTVIRRPLGLLASNQSFATKRIEEANAYNKNTRCTSNINYLYPSINEEGPTYDVRKIWNPPQAQSRVLTEDIGAGRRIKDLSVVDTAYYRSDVAASPFKDIPALQSITAESVHRLVQCLDLRYAVNTHSATSGGAGDGRPVIASVTSWDDRTTDENGPSKADYTTSDVDIYGPVVQGYRYGKKNDILGDAFITDANTNVYGVDDIPDNRRIVVVAPGSSSLSNANNGRSIRDAGILAPLYRPSILRASSHTWEYVGLGSGNYSTGFPNLQTRVLKPYEQFIAQGYENAGGFVASSGTNSNGDFYIGSQVVQAGGSSTVTLNVPKVRKSSESNYVDISNIENRISNSVVNVTATASKNTAGQNALKSLSNFFNTAKLSVTDTATIQNLVVNERLFIANTRINNAQSFPEASQEAYGFVKAARPEKTGFISTDTNDKLYVSPKFLDAWRVKRQLISAQNITLDNNRIYVQPLSRTLLDNSATGSVGLASTYTTVKVKESSGIPSYGIVDVDMSLKFVEVDDYWINNSSVKEYLTPRISVGLYYTGIDYTLNQITLNSNQNYKPRQTYLENVLGNSGFKNIIKHWSSPIDDVDNLSEKDIKYLTATLAGSNKAVSALDTPGGNTLSPTNTTNIVITPSSATATGWEDFPDRGAVTLREKAVGSSVKYSTYVYVKSSAANTLTLIRKVVNASGNDSGHTYTTNYDNLTAGSPSKNVFFTGCTTTVAFYDRWAREEPFIPSVDAITEDIDLESATLYTVPEKAVGYTGDIDEDFINGNLPNPFSAKALGVNLQNRQAVKKFAPLTNFRQAQSWCDNAGFNVKDDIELLLKPGYYKLDGATFPCKITVNGSGLKKSSIYAGKEQTGTSDGRMGGYLEEQVKRGDSIFFYRAPSFADQYGRRSDSFTSNVSGGLTAEGGFDFSNVHFLGMNEAVGKNEILDETYSSDPKVQSARRRVRKAFYIKSALPASTNAVARSLGFTCNSSAAVGKISISPYINSDDILVTDLDADRLTGKGSTNDCKLSTAAFTNARYAIITIEANKYAGSDAAKQDFVWARSYIIPGTTMYFASGAGTDVTNSTDQTKVLNVRYTDKTNDTTWTTSSTEKIELIVSIDTTGQTNTNKGNESSATNATEDLGISGSTLSNDHTATFVNISGSEFTTLSYNWCINRRRELLPKGFSWSEGYQPAIIKTVTTQVNSSGFSANSTTIAFDEGVGDIKTGDTIKGTGIKDGTTITVAGSTITLSDTITANLTAGLKVSFTQTDNFGNVLTKYDTPEVFGIIKGYEGNTINLVIDLNPNYEIDSSIAKYPESGFNNYVALMMATRTDTGEDAGVTLPYTYNGYKRITGTTSTRFVLLQVDPSEVIQKVDGDVPDDNESDPTANLNPYVDNRGIALGVLGRFGAYRIYSFATSGGYGTGATFQAVTASNISTTSALKTLLDTAITAGGTLYNSQATVTVTGTGAGAQISIQVNSAGAITGFNVSGTITTNYNGSLTVAVVDRTGYVNVNGNTVNTQQTSFRNDDEFIAVAKANLQAPDCPYRKVNETSSQANNAVGHNLYITWPYTHRQMRRRFKAASLPCTGNFCSPMLNVDAIPGSNVPFNLNNCTIGAQSPATTLANTFGGGYGGGLIRARGSNLSLGGTRFRGNVSLDWTGLMNMGTSRQGGSFTYGHSVEMLQMEDDNKLSKVGYGGGAAVRLGVARDDEDFQRITEFRSEANLFLEPSQDPYGNSADADSRTFPVKSYQAIRRFNLGDSPVTVFDNYTNITVSGRNTGSWDITSTGGSASTKAVFKVTVDANGTATISVLNSGGGSTPYSTGETITIPGTNSTYGTGNDITAKVTINPVGGLLKKTEISERFESPNPIRYDAFGATIPAGAPNAGTAVADTNTSGWRMRWGSQSITGWGSQSSNQLSFLYRDSETGRELVKNIFIGAFGSRIVKTANVSTSYAKATRVQLPSTQYNDAGAVTTGGTARLCVVTFSGSIPLTAAAGNDLKFITDFLTTSRYKYVTTSTSRYAKITSSGKTYGNLNLVEVGEQIEWHSDLRFTQSGASVANISRGTLCTLINSRSTAGGGSDNTITNPTVYISTNASGYVTTVDFVSYGANNKDLDTFIVKQGSTTLTNITFTAIRNLTDDIDVFENGEFFGVLPTNCFVLNSINNPSIGNLKRAVQQAKTVFKPGSYVQLSGSYYKIASDSVSYQNKPYIGVYKYVNENNISDIRANIVVMLEDTEYAPTYSSNIRMDIFETDDLLDSWPDKGRCIIGDIELCEFVKTGDPTSNTGYKLTLTRSMTKYFPSYIRDWEGLDPYDSLSADVTVESFIPTSIKLADPVDVTCFGFRRILPNGTTDNGITNETLSADARYIDPRGKSTLNISKFAISVGDADDANSANTIEGSLTQAKADANKLSIGSVVHIPYRIHNVGGAGVTSAVTCATVNAQSSAGSNVSSNRIGDRRIAARVLTTSGNEYLRYWYKVQLFGNSNTDSIVYNHVNPTANAEMYWSVRGGVGLSGANYYITPTGLRYYTYRWHPTTATYANNAGSISISGDTMNIQTPGSYTATLTTAGVMTVSAVGSGGLFMGQAITGSGIPAGAYISDYKRTGNALSGTGGTGTYQVSFPIGTNSPNISSGITVTGTEPASGDDYLVYYPGQTGYWQRRITSKSVNASTGVTTITLNGGTQNSTTTGGWILIYTYGASEDKAIFELDKALLKTIPDGSPLTFGIGRTIAEGGEKSTAKAKMFKTRVLDIKELPASKKIEIYLTDELPEDFADANSRHYGMAYFNHAGWTYPKTGGSSFRVNNVKTAGASATTIKLPNRSGRIQAGDTLSYEYEKENLSGAGIPSSTYGQIVKVSSSISAVSAVDGDGYSTCTISGSNCLHDSHASKHEWLSIGDIFVSHRTGNFVNNGPVCDKFIYTDTGLKMQFGDYNIWYENWGNYISSRKGINGRAGWVGNFALHDTGKVPIGIDFNGASSVQWGRQYNDSLWLAATPFTPRFMPGDYPAYMSTIQYKDGIESSLSHKTTSAEYDGTNTPSQHQFYPLNHMALATGSLYVGLNTSVSNLGGTDGGTDAYDTQQYRWSPDSTKLDWKLQDASIGSGDGSTTGGENSRVIEGLTISKVVHYKPVKHFETCNQSGTGSIQSATNSQTVTGSSGSKFLREILPGDQLYRNNSGTPEWIGTVKSIGSDTQLTLTKVGAVGGNITSSWSLIRSRVKFTDSSTTFGSGKFSNSPVDDYVYSGNSLTSGVTNVDQFGNNGFNTMISAGASAAAGHANYNFRFAIQKRTYNQTPLLNTKGELSVVSDYINAGQILKPSMGDLSRYIPANFNVQVTRINPKTHVERSISVVGRKANI